MSDRIVIRSDWFNHVSNNVSGVWHNSNCKFIIIFGYHGSWCYRCFISNWLFVPVWIIAALILLGVLFDDIVIILCTKYVFEHGHVRYHWKFYGKYRTVYSTVRLRTWKYAGTSGTEFVRRAPSLSTREAIMMKSLLCVYTVCVTQT